MTPLTAILREEIARSGPISFHRFMDAALYDPTHGYYRQPRDPFGKDGDFFTAEQLQPVFGILIAARIRMLYRDMGEPSDFTVVELGPGRGKWWNMLQLVRNPGSSFHQAQIYPTASKAWSFPMSSSMHSPSIA